MANNLNKPNRKGLKWALIAISLVIILGGLCLMFGGKLVTMKLRASLKGDYQAVFLTNGQVYFGKMDFQHGWIVLKDIYYLQLSEELQPASSGDSSTNAQTGSSNGQQQKIQLVKLGQELHGPQDEMFIAKDKILFWENMKDDSKVLQSIKQYQGN